MTIAQGVLGALLLGALIYTVVAYPARYGAISGRSRLFRTVGVFLLDLLFMLVFMYTLIDWGAGGKQVGAIRWVFYVASCFFLCFALACTAALDALEGFTAVRRERRRTLAEILQAEQERVAQDKADKDSTGKTGGDAV